MQPISQCGFVAIVGRPNVGKSTLLNTLIGQKISITANKPQTTRHCILGVKTVANQQVVYIDTPGIHKKEVRGLNKEMNKSARSALKDVDAVIFVVEGLQWTDEDQIVLDCINNLTAPIYLVINKVDAIKDKNSLLPQLQKLSAKATFKDLIPTVATKGVQVDLLQDKIFASLPESPFFFAETQTTDKSESFRFAEIIREKLTRELSAELPYALTVEVEQVERDMADKRCIVHAVIWVEKASQKAIVIGKKGSRLKQIGQQARLDMNYLLKNMRVHLQLWVKVRAGWSDDQRLYHATGLCPT